MVEKSDELHIKVGLAVEQNMVSRDRVAADDNGVGEFTGEAEGQLTIDLFKMPRIVDPVTSNESILPMIGAPSTVHVVWEAGLILNPIS